MRLPIEVAAAGAFPLGFTKRDLERGLGLLDAAAVIRYARLRGSVERIGRGRYRSRALPEDVEAYAGEMEVVREKLLGLDASIPAALDGSTAIWAWTRGGYVTGTTPLRTVVSVAVPRSKLKEVRNALRRLGADVRSDYPSANEFGVFVKLNPKKHVERTLVDGIPVISRRAVEKLIDSNPAFGPAREYLATSEGPIEVLR